MKVEVMLTKSDNIDILAEQFGLSAKELEEHVSAAEARKGYYFFELEMTEDQYRRFYTLRGVYFTRLE